MPRRLIAAVFLTLFVVACGDDSPTAPSGASSLTFGAIAPAAGGSVTTTGQLPGAMIVRGSGQVSIPITVFVRRELPWAQLSVYLMTADGTYCGQNSPESPVWRDIDSGWSDRRRRNDGPSSGQIRRRLVTDWLVTGSLPIQ